EQGEAAARALLTALADAGKLEDESVDTQLVVRDSCGCRLRLQNDSRQVEAERPRVARTCRLALIERRTALRAELARAAAGRLGGSHDWEGRLIDSLSAQLDSDEGGAFLWEFERVARLHQSGGGDPLVCHDVISALRLQALICAEVQPAVRPRLEDLFQEARVLLARVSVAIAHEHLESVGARTRVLVRACLEQVGVPDPLALHDALVDHLPRLGVSAFTVARFAPGFGEWLDVISTKAPRALESQDGSATSERLHLSSLGIDAALEAFPVIVVEPLGYAGRAVGTACFAWGALEPSLYEQLRDLLSLSLSPPRAAQDPASAELLRWAGS
ncbi:MAG TPA: hypothetical protein VLC09_09135, partial [Polyangiaceae bacterium]|nr:hypothetical protein [Polyangiaceae bacterium]